MVKMVQFDFQKKQQKNVEFEFYVYLHLIKVHIGTLAFAGIMRQKFGTGSFIKNLHINHKSPIESYFKFSILIFISGKGSVSRK